MLPDQGDQAFIGLTLGQVVLHAVLADVEIDLSRGAADVPEVGIRHLTWAVHDAAHDRKLHPLEMAGLLADALRGGLQVKEGAPTGGAGYKLGLGDAGPCALQEVVGELGGSRGVGLGLDTDQVPNAVAKQRTGQDRRFQQPGKEAGVGLQRDVRRVADPEGLARSGLLERLDERILR